LRVDADVRSATGTAAVVTAVSPHAEAHRRTRAQLRRFRLAVARRCHRDERAEQALGRLRHLIDGAALAFEGLLKPESLRTNWSAEARISSSVAGGEKLYSVLMLRHIRILLSQQALEPY